MGLEESPALPCSLVSPLNMNRFTTTLDPECSGSAISIEDCMDGGTGGKRSTVGLRTVQSFLSAEDWFLASVCQFDQSVRASLSGMTGGSKVESSVSSLWIFQGNQRSQPSRACRRFVLNWESCCEIRTEDTSTELVGHFQRRHRRLPEGCTLLAIYLVWVKTTELGAGSKCQIPGIDILVLIIYG